MAIKSNKIKAVSTLPKSNTAQTTMACFLAIIDYLCAEQGCENITVISKDLYLYLGFEGMFLVTWKYMCKHDLYRNKRDKLGVQMVVQYISVLRDLGWGSLSQISLIVTFFQNYQNTGYLLNISFIFDRGRSNDTYQIRIWLNGYINFAKSEKWEINEQNISNQHPRKYRV